jgi:hypothetical protein
VDIAKTTQMTPEQTSAPWKAPKADVPTLVTPNHTMQLVKAHAGIFLDVGAS